MANAYDDLVNAEHPASAPDGQNAYADLAPPEWKIGRVKPGNPFAISKNSPVYGEGDWQMALEGTGRGMMNVVRHAGNLMGLESNQELANANELDQPLMSQPGGRFGSMAGETALLAPATMGVEGALGATAIGAKALSNPFLRGAAEGASQGALMADPGHKGAGALTGGVTGLAIPATMTAGQKLAYGLSRTPEAEQLIQQGVRLTPGQMNPEGVWNKIEENVRSLPVVGNIVEKARTQSQQDFQRGVIEESAAPGYTLTSKSKDPNDLFQEAQDSYRPLYKAAEGFPVKPMVPSKNQTLAYALRQAADNKAVGAGQDIRQNAQDFLHGQLEAVGEKANASGGWKSEHLIQLRSGINEEIRNAGQDQAGKKYAQLLRAGRDNVTTAINDQIPADAAQSLQTANDAYPKLAIIRDAIQRGGDQTHGFTPAQLSSAVRSATEDNQYARGGGLMRDWSSAGRDIFTERNPRTGASHGTTGALAGLGYAIHHFVPGMQVPAAIGAGGALGMIGTQTGRNILSGQTGTQQAARRLAAALQSYTSPGAREIIGSTARTSINRAAPLNPHIAAYLNQIPEGSQ